MILDCCQRDVKGYNEVESPSKLSEQMKETVLVDVGAFNSQRGWAWNHAHHFLYMSVLKLHG